MDWDKLISKVLTYQLNVSIPKSSFLNCGHSLKVSQFLKEFLLSSILPKNQRNNSIIEVFFGRIVGLKKKISRLCLTFSNMKIWIRYHWIGNFQVLKTCAWRLKACRFFFCNFTYVCDNRTRLLETQVMNYENCL